MYFLLFLIVFTSIDSNSAQSFNATAFCTSINGNGLYPYENSYNCSQYVKCYSYDGTRILGWVYKCPGTTLFNPIASYCQDAYTCIPPSTTTSTTQSTTTSTTSITMTMSTTTKNPPPFNATAFCSTQNRGYYPYPTGCVKYINCYFYDGITMLGSVLTCLGTTAFNPTSSTLANSYYPYPGTTNCTQYIKCFSNGVSMVGVVYTCVGTTLFNPDLLYCQSGYVCIPATTSTTVLPTTTVSVTSTTVAPTTTVAATATTTVAPTTTVSVTSTTTVAPTTTVAAFNANSYCSALANSNYPYPGTTNCTQYVKCFSNGVSMVGVVYTCVGTTLFNPDLLYCQSGYVCIPTTTSTTVAPTTTAAATATTTVAPTTTVSVTSKTTVAPTTTVAAFNANSYCSALANSNYPYPGTTNCTQYVKCFSNGVSMVGVVYTCVGTTLFNPDLLYCQSGYVCIPTTTSTTVAPTTTAAATATTTVAPTTTVSVTSTATVAPTTTVAAFNANSYCSALANSNYPYPGTTNCTQYVKCFLNGVNMVGVVYTCVGTTLFNPALLYCQSGYVCIPETTSTTVAPTTTVSVTSTTTIAPTTTETILQTTTETVLDTTTEKILDTTTETVLDPTTETVLDTTTETVPDTTTETVLETTTETVLETTTETVLETTTATSAFDANTF
ncbi:unnamed protein product [Chironomus riparius]|uniref:Chitin-binding type-2 domain-containing protein n=1 Tax=Chironomus riparius TaxID=315576 RepID=A0A9N9WQP2_9DIPT|nr:unnamed protein product [Chironomus riparius]